MESPIDFGVSIVDSFWSIQDSLRRVPSPREVVLDYPCAWIDLVAARSELGGIEPIFTNKPNLCAFPRSEAELLEYVHAWMSRWGGIPRHQFDFWDRGPFELLPLFEQPQTSQRLLDASQGSALRLLPSADRLRLSNAGSEMINAVYEEGELRGRLPYFACSLEYAAAYVTGIPDDALLVVVFPEVVEEPSLVWFLEDHTRDRGAKVALVENVGGKYALRDLI